MLKTIVFVETTLTHAEAKAILPDACYMPSIKKGDVIRAIKDGYTRIMIIDGNFGWVPSVWHKEILIALDYGIEVFGASSMGAIRAAELDIYGMKGFGYIYDMYKTGQIDGDDEIAIAYSRLNNFQTVPLINIRNTLQHLNLKNKKNVFEKIKKIFYAERTWSKIEESIPREAFTLIQSNYIDIKKEDALLALTAMKDLPEKSVIRPRINKIFTVFEKIMIESILGKAIYNRYTFEQNGDLSQMIRAKNIIKLLDIPKSRQNLLYYQSLIYLIDKDDYTISESELINQANGFREEKNLLNGNDFKHWLVEKWIAQSNLEIIFTDYVKINKHLFLSLNFNNYFN